jgi:hypothetical protein
MKVYIKNSKAISPQQSFAGTFPWNEPLIYKGIMHASEPDYKQLIEPLKLRRMSRVVKMGVVSALACLNSSNTEKIQAIITATGWGCLTDTYKFLDEIIDINEESLSPATFIQSTHNTVGGQIALMLECQEYNNVYVNHTFSFEYGLLDAMLLIAEGKENVLLGGIDEIADKDYELKNAAGYWKENPIENIKLLTSISNGSIAGEGATFFLLSKTLDEGCVSQISNVIFSKAQQIKNRFKYEFEISPEQIDVLISGYNGDIRLKKVYNDFIDINFPGLLHTYYKHLCGEYDTSSAFALWLANEIIKTQTIPEYLFMQPNCFKPKKINHILIHHFTEPDEHAFILVSKASL